jgi:hypothetical protein
MSFNNEICRQLKVKTHPLLHRFLKKKEGFNEKSANCHFERSEKSCPVKRCFPGRCDTK